MSTAPIVIVLESSVSVMPVLAAMVTGVEPDVLELITEVDPVPAPTVNPPSFVSDKSPVFPMTVPTTEMPVPAV